MYKWTVHMARATLVALCVANAPCVRAELSPQVDRWPSKMVRIVLPTPPGAPIDALARVLQPKLQDLWGKPVVIENRPGGSGLVAMQEVIRSADNHTFFGGPDSTLTVWPHVYRNLKFDPVAEMVPVTYLAGVAQVLVCRQALGLRSVNDLVEAASKKSMNYATGGAGLPSHMSMEMLLNATSIKMIHVPYRGPAPAAQDIVGGQVDCGFLPSIVATPFILDGRISALAMGTDRRWPSLPNVPTIAEGISGFNSSFFETILAPRAMPKEIVRKVSADLKALMSAPDMPSRLADFGLVLVASSPEEATSRAAADSAKWGRVAKAINLTLD